MTRSPLSGSSEEEMPGKLKMRNILFLNGETVIPQNTNLIKKRKTAVELFQIKEG